MTHYNIFYNGCSFTFGSEIAGSGKKDKRPGEHEYYEYRMQNRYSQLITDKTGLTHCNIALPAVSNDHILESTVDWFEQGNTCDLAVIQWTQRFRFVYYNNIGKRLNINGSNPEILKKSKHKLKFNGLDEYPSFHTYENDQYRSDMNMYWMNYFLKDKCNVIYLKLQEEPVQVNPNYYETALYPKHYNTHIDYVVGGILPKLSLIDGIFPNNMYYNGGHPSTAGHKKIADHIINIIKSRGS